MDGQLVNVNRKRARREEDDSEEMDFMMVILRIVIFGIWHLGSTSNDSDIPREPPCDYDHDRQIYLNSIIRGCESDCIEQLCVSKQCFANLCKLLSEKDKSTRMKHVPIEDAVAMFLHILGHNLKYRIIHKNYYRSKETISRQFNSVLCVVMRVSKDYLKANECVLGEADASKWKWFENSLGALDGTHIPLTVSMEEQARYQNRKGYLSTNMLGACTPDLKFTYILLGWEGLASDSRVLHDALCSRHLLHIPNDKYYLVDAGYTNGPSFLAPYRGTKYHLNEWRGNTLQNYKELFNLRHSSARNAIERLFGVLKKRWSVLRTPSFFDMKTQIRIISACCVLHNFIRIKQSHDRALEAQHLELLDLVDPDLSSEQQVRVNENLSTEDEITCVQVSEQWTAFCETLAKEMFDDYQARRG